MGTLVSELEMNEDVTAFYMLSEDPIVRKSKKNKDYLCLKLRDKSGEVDARVWEIAKELDQSKLKAGAIVKVFGNVSVWNEEKQFQINKIRLFDSAIDADIEYQDFFERSVIDPKMMFMDLIELLGSVLDHNNPIKQLLSYAIETNREKLLIAPAAKSMHHCYIGGLLEHTLSMAKTAVVLSQRYNLQIDLLLAGVILHDIGKTREMTYPLVSYTVEGTLLGHIVMGMEMATEYMGLMGPLFDPKLKMSILHLIASHHGLLEWGSPKVPLMREAVALHLIDMIDAKIAMCDRAIMQGVDEHGMTQWVKGFDGPIFKLGEKT